MTPLFSFLLCSLWSPPRTLSHLPAHDFPEVSGLASSQDGRSWFAVNDSGPGEVRVLSRDGRPQSVVKIDGYRKVKDLEAIARGPCSGSSCLFLADIGDNGRNRRSIDVIAIREPERGATRATIHRQWSLRYPDRAHDAEAFVVAPNGDFFIFTKEYTSGRPPEARPTNAFRWSPGSGDSGTLEAWGGLDLKALVPESAPTGQIVTDASLAAGRWMLLTYDHALEMSAEKLSAPLDGRTWRRDRDYRKVELDSLAQQESLALSPDGRMFVYSSESEDGDENPPFLGVDCQNDK